MIIGAGSLLTGTASLGAGWVEVAGDRVVALGSGLAPGPVDLDLSSATITPGFVDMHVHGGGGGAFPEATASAVAAAVGLHRRHGTTAMMASLVSEHPATLLHQVTTLADHVESGDLLGIHLEGPWLSPQRGGAHESSALRGPTPDEVETLLAAARGTIRMVTIAPELPGAMDAIRRLCDAGVVVAIGHTDATYDQARAAIDAGATVATHLFNAMRPVHHREPGPVVAALEDPRVTVELITDGVHLHPALHRLVTAEVGVDRVALVTDAMAAAGMADGAYTLGSLNVEVVDGVARLAGRDTIAGSTATMALLVAQAVHNSRAERADAMLTAVRQVTVNPLRALGLPAPGLAEGAPADLVVLSPDLDVVGVMRQGTWLRRPGSPGD
ncbi:N-acetylglucosamine-6-phosphate deacetylase [Nostocoides sp. F2B08]|uniref:N-acetylglucosamine-6-phosphate deacetylase n=1 Tax=Nostocoides sp. F2B08 TaxID=2653936 RepID=UPI001262FF06|nr:N-acetylglucosamine-6-phosphate deacetylase [Tetrasphaera sp. F2B08]KAB7745398.1 N-acetylglucosamine-6-phosphate deacetylase [Tetrasphaera sp. F2B08]